MEKTYSKERSISVTELKRIQSESFQRLHLKKSPYKCAWSTHALIVSQNNIGEKNGGALAKGSNPVVTRNPHNYKVPAIHVYPYCVCTSELRSLWNSVPTENLKEANSR